VRPYAREYVFYLRRRVEDYPLPEMPTPKWTDLDHEAVATVLNELERLHQFYRAAKPELDRCGSRVALTYEDETTTSTYDIAPATRRARIETLLLVLASVAAGAGARFLYDAIAHGWASALG
jgi:hypothetical protein